MSKLMLNTYLCGDLRNKVNEYQHYSITKTHSIKNDKFTNGWKTICAIMDRIEDTAIYLNEIDLRKTNSRLCIFNFYNFMNISASLLDNIKFLAEIYDYDLSDIDKKTDIFNQLGSNHLGTDKRYFEYLRSLCSVHPIETNHQKEFLDIYTKVECCPFVIWKNDDELEAVVYINNPDQFSKHIEINVPQIFQYINYRFNVLKLLITHIDLYYQSIIDEYRKQILKNETDFKDIINYIEYLKNEYQERVNTGYDEIFEFYQNVFKFNFSNIINKKCVIKYQNAIIFSLRFLQNYLQKLPNKDEYETTGLKKQPPHTSGSCLFNILFEIPYSNKLEKFDYAFEKLSFLMIYNEHPLRNNLIDESKEFWEKYVYIEKAMTSMEICILIHIAFYFWRLENEEYFSESIPNIDKYR